MKCPHCHVENKDDSRFCSNCAAPLGVAGPEAASLTKTLETPVRVMKAGTVIAGKYKIVEEIGRGGMGIVYKAEDLKLKRFVALKFLPPHLMSSPELKERFLVEAQAAAALNHPNICVIYEVGEDGGRSFIAMEYVEGETLRDKIKKGPQKIEDTLAIIGQVAAGLGEAYRKGIVHRDVKSANIMVTAMGQAKVMDFGLAKLRGGSSITKSQTTLGTVAYMSPEQARGDMMDGRTDIWSLGVVLYEMLTGELPFKGDHDQAVIHSILHREPKPLKKIQAGAPSGVGAIVLNTLAKRPADRYQTMEELRQDLEAVAEGLKPLKARQARKILRMKTARALSGLAVVLALILGLNIGGLRNRLFFGADGSERGIKLAVLPFANLSGDPEQEYLSDGLTEEMIVQLGRLHPQSLSVIARTSVMRYKNNDTPIDQIGRELGVDYVLEGSSRREAGRVRISAELIQVRDQMQLWSDSYEREMSGILALQSDVARRVAGALALKLLPDEQVRLANVRTVNPEAYEAYLKGVQSRQFLTEATLEAAERYFNRALQEDPNFAAAWAGIARVWNGRGQMGITPPKEAISRSKEAALKALELDGTEWEAHRALAGILTWGEWDWPAAERKWDELIVLNPNDVEVLTAHSHFLMHMGRQKEAMTEIEKAVGLDPFSVRNLSFYARDLIYARRYDDAIAAAQAAMRLQPGAPVARMALMDALFLKGMFDEAFRLEKERRVGDRELAEALEQGYAESGYAGAQRRLADVLSARFGRQGNVSAYYVANLYLRAGDKERTLQWLERAYGERDGNMPYIGSPVFDSLRPDPRYQDLLRRIGLPTDEKK
jgi:TolB-like protein/tetratricopeptide (TPR) repeat protein/predicted Ser/Thr protein kinase